MRNNKFSIHLIEDGISKNILAKSISYVTATRLYNQLTNPPFNHNSHDFKCHDSFSIVDKNSNIRLVMFYGSEIDTVVYRDGTQKTLEGKYEYIGDLKPTDDKPQEE